MHVSKSQGVANDLDADNILVDFASPLLRLAVELRHTASPRNIEQLWAKLRNEIATIHQRAMAAGIPQETVRTASYSLCAMIDDVVLNTPWGANSVWASRSLLSSFHGEVTGGKQFYEILARAEQAPAANASLLKLMYLCLSLGFEGQYRIANRGAAHHEQTRETLYARLRNLRVPPSSGLSPHWAGINAPHQTRTQVPVWVVAAGFAVISLVVFAALTFALSRLADEKLLATHSLPPTGPVTIARAATPIAPPLSPPTAMERLLQKEIDERLVAVTETGQSLRVRLTSQALFKPGRAQIEGEFEELILRIARELNKERGQIIITGHTDDIPIRTLRFPSNWELSKARAEGVANLMASVLRDTARISTRGLANSEPIVANDTPERRAQNRRIEIVLQRFDRAASEGP